MTAPDPIPRSAARVLLIDGRDRLLLFHGSNPDEPDVAPYWFTAGGGLDPGESQEKGALRELYEETGLRLTAQDLVGPVWEDTAEFRFEGRTYRQSQVFFVARVDTWEVDTSALQEAEARSIDTHRWWSAAELDRADEAYYPADLSTLLRRALARSEVQ